MKTQELTLMQMCVLHNMVRYKCTVVEWLERGEIYTSTNVATASKIHTKTLKSLIRRGLAELIRKDYEPGSDGTVITQRSWAVTEKGKDVYHQQKRGYVN